MKFYYNLNGGLNTELTPVVLGSDTKRLYWAEAVNIEPYKNQGITRQKGNKTVAELSKLIESKTEDGKTLEIRPVSITPFTKSGNDIIIGLNDGRIFLYDSALGSIKFIWDFEVSPEKYIFVHFLDGIVISPLDYKEEAVNSIFFKLRKNKTVEEGISFIDFKDDNGNFLKPECGAQYAGRLWFSIGNTLYYTALGTFNDWTTEHDAGYISKFHSSTEKITAINPYSGALAIYKDFEVFLLTGSDPEDFSIVKFADKGTLNESCVLTCNNKQYFFNYSGLFCLSMSGELNQIVMGENLALNITKMFENLDTQKLRDTYATVCEKKNEIWIFPKIKGEIGKKQVWIYNWAQHIWYIREIPYEITDAASILGEIYTITPDEGGRIFIENKGNTFSKKPVIFRFSTPFFNFSKPTTQKIIDDFEIIFGGNSDNNFIFYVSKDYITACDTQPEVISVENPNVLYWSGEVEGENPLNVWGNNENSFTWADSMQENFKMDIFDALKSVQLHFEGNSPEHDLTVIGFEFKNICFED